MTRREALALLAAGSGLRAQDGQAGTEYRNYSRCLPDYLTSLARESLAQRTAQLAKLDSAAAIRARQQYVRSTFWQLIGGQLEKTPLHVKTVGGFDRPSYRVEKLIYQSRPDFYVPALLYIPKNAQPPFPGVLFHMGHAPNGKASPTYQSACQGLVQLGFLVLAFDPMGQGERIYYPNAAGTATRLGSPDDEHSVAGKQMLLVGDTATRMQLWDAIRSLDVLESHPQVDRTRLASTGQSGGGTVTMLLLAADDRLASAVVCSGNTEDVVSEEFDPPGPVDDAEQNLVYAGPHGIGRWDLFYPFAPKPLLVSVSDKDWFGTYGPNYIRDGRREFGRLERVYDGLGASGRLAWSSTPMPHGLAYDTRVSMYNWFARWLQKRSTPIEAEPPVTLEPDKTLWVTSSGSVLRDYNSESPATLARKAKPFALARYEPPPVPATTATVLRSIRWRGARVQALDIPTDPKVFVPAWLYLPEGKPSDCLVLLQRTRLANWRENELFHKLAQMGHAVCAPDLRGAGDLAGEFPGGGSPYARGLPREEAFAWTSLVLGRPLLVQRVTDILGVLAALPKLADLEGVGMKLAADPHMCVPALFAAQQAREVSSLYLSGPLVSFRSVVDNATYRDQFADFFPGMLAQTDLPDLVQALAPRRVTLAGPVDGAGRPAAPAAASHVTVHPRARWDVESLTSF